MLADYTLQFLIHGEARTPARAGRADILPPFLEFRAPLFDGGRLLIRHVIDFPAKGVEGLHALTLFPGQKNESESEIRGALARDRLTRLHDSLDGTRRIVPRGKPAGFRQGRF